VDEIGTGEEATIIFAHTGAGNTTTYTLTTNETVPANIGIWMEHGAIIDGAGTLTINGPFEAGHYQTFSGAGTVTINPKYTNPIKACWYGFDESATAVNNATYLNRAVSGLQQYSKLDLGIGQFSIDSATIAGFTNDVMTIPSSDITIEGHGYDLTKITISGTTECGLFYALNRDNISIKDAYFYGNSVGATSSNVGDGQFYYYSNTGASAHHSGIFITNCKIENFKAIKGIIYIVRDENNFDISDIRIEENVFRSLAGNQAEPTTTNHNAFLCLYSKTAGTGYIKDFTIADNIVHADYAHGFCGIIYRAKVGEIKSNIIYNAGQYGEPDNNYARYAIMIYGSPISEIGIHDNKIFNPYECGIYCLNGTNIKINDNFVNDQDSTNDSTLSKGGIVANGQNIDIKDNRLENCKIGIVAQPENYYSNITVNNNVIDGVNDSVKKGILVREHGTTLLTGGLTIEGNRIRDGKLILYRGSSASTYLYDILVENNSIELGQIYVTSIIYKTKVSNNVVNAQNQTRGICFIAGGIGIDISGNSVFGPGPDDGTASYGIYAYLIYNPSSLMNNHIEGWTYALYNTSLTATLWGNTMLNCYGTVPNIGNALGFDTPSWGRWHYSQLVQDIIPTAGATIGWTFTAPAFGNGNWTALSTTADMTITEEVITDIADISGFRPGDAIDLANAAAGPATLSTVIESLKFTYGTLTDTFETGEIVKGDTSGTWGRIFSDNGSDTMYVVEVYGDFDPTEDITGLKSGATAKLSAIDFKVHDACENTVDDQTLTPVDPVVKTWGSIAA